MTNSNAPLMYADFSALTRTVTEIIKNRVGMNLGEKQMAMIKSRLTKRILDLHLDSPEAYQKYILKNLEQESTVLVSLLTTHHTFFFREFDQLEFVGHSVLKKMVENLVKENRTVLKVASVACSRGQEVYSLAMYLDFHLKKINPSISFDILGMDIDQDSIKVAQNAVYRWEEIKEIPSIYLANHWARGTGDIAEYVKLKPNLKRQCRFIIENILHGDIFKKEKFDLVFCRNVFIYFAPEQIAVVAKKIAHSLNKGGIFCLGISETLNNLNLPFTFLGHSAYCHQGDPMYTKATKEVGQNTDVLTKQNVKDEPGLVKIRVLCVDDSPSVIMILKSILKPEFGFEVVATAANGNEAAEKAEKVPFDIMTLDIHMPEKNGVEYLEKHFNKKHPPVVMVSSVAREEAELGIRSLELGAADYVEKPSLATLAERSEELRTKLRCAFLARDQSSNGNNNLLEMTKSFERFSKITHPEKGIRILVSGAGDLKKISNIARHLNKPQPATFLFFDCATTLIQPMVELLAKDCSLTVETYTGQDPKIDTIYVAMPKQDLDKIKASYSERQTSILLFADISDSVCSLFLSWPKAQTIIEDLGEAYMLNNQKHRMNRATKCIPFTSFLFDSDEFLNQV